jgi:hypothetical protein
MKRSILHSSTRWHRDPRLLPFFLLCTIILAAHAAFAGTICGTVRDAMTSGPVDKAGIFVRTLAGAYTGCYGATDATGNFCINGIPTGTYDLEFRVDDYATGYIRNVEVTNEPTSVQIELDVPFYFAPPWPNPAQGGISFRFRAGEGAPLRLLIFDPAGRLVRGWSDPAGSSGERFFLWNLTDQNGTRVPSGVYFARLSAGDIHLVRSIVVVQ